MGATGHVLTLARNDAAQRDAAGNALGRADDVRLHTPMLDGPPAPGAPDAGLHFVCDQQDAMFVAQFTQQREEGGRRRNIAAFALDWLDQDRRHVFGATRLLKTVFLR